MDKIQSIAISHIADVISTGKLLIAEVDVFKKIFYNAGLSDYYEKYKNGLKITQREVHWKMVYKLNTRTYTTLLDIFNELIVDMSEFVKLINCILEKIPIRSIYSDNVERIIHNNSFGNTVLIEEYIEKKGSDKATALLQESPSKDFVVLRSNLNLLMLDISFSSSLTLTVSPLTLDETESNKKSNMINWLEINYPNILESYESAYKMCSEGNPVECLSSCRNVITGIFTYDKQEGTKWYTGLKAVCSDDKNIENVTSPSHISSWKNNMTHDTDVNKRYNYPRYKTISQIYSFLSDLGPHKDEANITSGIVDYETPSLEDAFWGLRMTESILIWLYQNKKNI